MNVETGAVITKGWCLISGAMAAGIAVGLATIEAPSAWHFWLKISEIILGAYSVGCNALVAFLSQSFGDWKKGLNGNGAAAPPAPVVKSGP